MSGITNTDAWAKAGVMMRETLAAGSRNASVFVTPGAGVAFQRRTTQNGSSTSTTGSASKAPVWLKVERAGSTFSAYESSDGLSWALVGRDTLSVGSTLYVGVAVTSHSPAALTTATVTDVAVITPLAAGWTFSDVGSPTPAGAAASSGSSFAVAAGGADVWGTSDQFGFLYREISGDADIIARVSDLQTAHTWTKAGLMVRDSLSANASHAFALASGSNGLALQTRPQSGGSSQQVGSRNGAAPVWLKLERRGATVNAFTSNDGTQWTSLGTANVTMADPVYVGMAVTSHNRSQLASAVFGNVTVRELSLAGNIKPIVTLTSPSAGAVFATSPASVTLTATASDADGSIGWVEFYSGSTLLGSDTSAPFTMRWDGVADGMYSVTAVAFDNRGESTTSAPVSFTVGSTSPTQPGALPSGWTTADVGSPALAGSASHANGTYTLQGAGVDIWDTSDQFRFAYRTVTGDVDVIAKVTGITNTDPWAKAGLMFRGALTGGSVNALVYASAGAGVSFQRRVAASDMTTPINQTGAAPIWLKLSRRGQLVQAYRSTDGANWTQMTSETISLPSTFYVGLAVTSHNESAVATGTFTDVTVTAAAAANQAPSVSLTAPASGSSYTAPASTTVSASASDADGTISKVDFYAGSTLIGSDTSSPYSVTWSNVQAGSYALTAVATDNAGATTTSAARQITVSAASGGGTTQPGALPSGWTTADVGAPALAGSASQANGTYTLQGAGVDIWDTSDQFRFAYRTMTGDVDVIAKVTGITNTDPWAKAGLMFRGAMTGSSVNAMVYASPGAGVSYQRRVAASDMTTPINQTGGAPIWLKLSRRGQLVQAYRSTDGVNWTQMTSETISLPSTYYVGLAVTSHNESAVATGTFSDVTVTAVAASQPPSVSLTAPASGSSYTAPASVTVSASASDTDGTISKVDFYAGSTLIGSDTSSPYSVTWTNAPAGSHVLTAVATDNAGRTTTSAGRTITISGGTGGTGGVTKAAFAPSADHNTLVQRYVLDVFAAGANPATATPVRSQDLGKPSVVNGECSADITTTLQQLGSGSYIATVSAVGSGGSTRSAPASFSK